jgi:hypothetical protein
VAIDHALSISVPLLKDRGRSIAPSSFLVTDARAMFLGGFDLISEEASEHYWENAGKRQFSSYWRILAKKANCVGSV